MDFAAIHAHSLELARKFRQLYLDCWMEDANDALEEYKECRRQLPGQTRDPVYKHSTRYGALEAWKVTQGISK